MSTKPRHRICLAVYPAKVLHDVYEDVSSIRLSDARLMRNRRNKELVVAQKVILEDVAIDKIVRLSHYNLAAIHCIFASNDLPIMIYDYLELCFCEFAALGPLTKMEIASAASQFVSATHYLDANLPPNPFPSVRLALSGRVKLIFNFGIYSDCACPTAATEWDSLANEADDCIIVDEGWHSFYNKIISKFKTPHISQEMLCNPSHAIGCEAPCEIPCEAIPCEACDFFKTSENGIPPPDHEFLQMSSGPRGLASAAARASKLQQGTRI